MNERLVPNSGGAPMANKVGCCSGWLRPRPRPLPAPQRPPRAGEPSRNVGPSGDVGRAVGKAASPSSRRRCHPYAQDHSGISSIRPGKEAFKLLILYWGAVTELPRTRSAGSAETDRKEPGSWWATQAPCSSIISEKRAAGGRPLPSLALEQERLSEREKHI